jgi:hypothetical protein
MAVAVQLDLITLLLAAFAAVLAPFAAVGDHALAGRMRALYGLCHRNLPISMYVSASRVASTNTVELEKAARMRAMRVINRTAISIVGAQPYIDWTRTNDADAVKGMLTVVRARPYGTAYLLPEFELEEDVQEWIEDNAGWMFEFALSAWTEDESTWPPSRDVKMFRAWFRIDIHSLVVDVGEDEIEGEEL